MSLQFATVIAVILLLLPGIWFLWNGKPVEKITKKSLRNSALTILLMAVGTIWFLSIVLDLGEAEFGKYKNLLFLFFLGTSVGSWFYARDFLAVRAWSIITLLSANTFLKAAFGLYDTPSRLVLVTGTYISIVVALYLGASPFRARDYFNWLFLKATRVRAFGAFLSAWSLALLIAMTMY